MADYLSSDDFAQKLKELGYLPSPDSQPKSEEENAALQPPAPSPTPSNEAFAEEQSRARDPNFQTDFPEPQAQPPSTLIASNKDSISDANTTDADDEPTPANAGPQTSIKGPATPITSTPSTAPSDLSSNPELNDKALVNAQNQVQQRQLFTGIGDALATAAAAPTGKGPDEAFFKEQMENAQTPVKNLEARRQLFERNVLVAGQTADAAIKQMNAEQQKQLNDPNSSPSQFIKSLLANQYSQNTDAHGNKIDITKSPGWDQLSGRDALDFQKMIASQEHLQTLKDQLQFRGQQADKKAETHATDKQVQSQQKLSQALNTFRGDTAAQQANVGLLNSDKAMQLINSTPDLNNLNEQQYALLRAEVAKIATGGAATQASQHDLQAQTLESKAAKFWQSVSGEPTGAQLGDFIKQNKDYLQHLNDVNHKYIDDKRENILHDYKGQVQDDTYNDFYKRYLPNRTEGEGGMVNHSEREGAPGTTKPGAPLQQQASTQSNSDQVQIVTSDGQHLSIPKANLDKARQRDPNLQVIQ